MKLALHRPCLACTAAILAACTSNEIPAPAAESTDREAEERVVSSTEPAPRTSDKRTTKPAPTPADAAVTYQRVDITKFFGGQVAALPLSLEIPSSYVHAAEIKAPATYAYWMQNKDVAEATRTGTAQAKSGYLYGKISLDEAFDINTGKFSSEDSFETDMAEGGLKVIQKKRFDVSGYPVLSAILQAQDGTIVCSLFLGTLIDTNVLYFGYRPPMNSLPTGRKVWGHITNSIQKTQP